MPKAGGAIVVLTGGDVRLAEGFALVDRGGAKKMLISGVSSGVDMPALLQTLNGTPQPTQAVLDCCVTLGYDARSTEGNARESLRWLGENNFTTIRLVTANYHMNRSLLEFRRVMPQITVIANPVFPRQVQDPYWFGTRAPSSCCSTSTTSTWWRGAVRSPTRRQHRRSQPLPRWGM